MISVELTFYLYLPARDHDLLLPQLNDFSVKLLVNKKECHMKYVCNILVKMLHLNLEIIHDAALWPLKVYRNMTSQQGSRINIFLSDKCVSNFKIPLLFGKLSNNRKNKACTLECFCDVSQSSRLKEKHRVQTVCTLSSFNSNPNQNSRLMMEGLSVSVERRCALKQLWPLFYETHVVPEDRTSRWTSGR